MKNIKIMLIDDHSILRSGLKMLINNEKDMQVIAEADSGKDALEKIKSVSPDIIILDITLGDINGLEVIREIKKKKRNPKIIILTMHNNENYMKEFIKEGVFGYVLKQSADTELINAIRCVDKNKIFIDSSLTPLLLNKYLGKPERKLSQREEEVLKLLVKGYINKEIAAKLKISIKTVETYRKRIREKIGISGRAELLNYAIKKGLFNPDIE
jgi:two-component system response regulator NreC